jgi:hypothetical protein
MKLLRFTLRDLLWLVVVAALAAAWWADHRKRTDANDGLKKDLLQSQQNMPILL